MQITYQERLGEDGEPVSVPVIPPGATADKIEAIVAAEGAASKLEGKQSQKE